MTRKRFKSKARSCGLCRPWKRGKTSRWSDRDLARLKAFEKALGRGDWSKL